MPVPRYMSRGLDPAARGSVNSALMTADTLGSSVGMLLGGVTISRGFTEMTATEGRDKDRGCDEFFAFPIWTNWRQNTFVLGEASRGSMRICVRARSTYSICFQRECLISTQAAWQHIRLGASCLHVSYFIQRTVYV